MFLKMVLNFLIVFNLNSIPAEEIKIDDIYLNKLNYSMENTLEENVHIEKETEIIGSENVSDTKIETTENKSSNWLLLAEYINKGLDNGKLDHRNTILRFQAENNLVADGIFGVNSKKVFESSVEVIDKVPNEIKNKEWFIVINKSKRILTVYKNGEIYKKYPVAIGKPSSPTPNYKFTIINKLVNPYWGGMGGKYTPVKGGDPKNPLGKRWLGLSTNKYTGYGIHGNSAPFSIGKQVSAGCVRMINEDVEELFEYIPKGTNVWIGTEEVLNEWGVKQIIEIQ